MKETKGEKSNLKNIEMPKIISQARIRRQGAAS